MEIFTASWFGKLPESTLRIGISRGTPRGFPAGYRKMMELAPGPWFNRVAPADYLALFSKQLAELQPRAIVAKLEHMSEGRDVALCCYESTAKIAAGETWCHRHIVAAWLEGAGHPPIVEVGAPAGFDRWGHLRREGIAPPAF